MGAIEFGQLIRSARLRRGWQQQELADRIGVDRGYISAIENGKRNWPQTYIAPLSSVLALDQVEMAAAAGLITVDRSLREESPPYDPVSAATADWPERQKQLLWQYIEAVSAALDSDDPPISAVGDDESKAS